MRTANGELVLSNQEKVGPLARALRQRFSAPAALDPPLPFGDPNNVELPPFRGRAIGPFSPIQMVEPKKALHNSAGGKSPGPDGPPMELFQRLKSLRPFLLKLLSAICATGHMPLDMRVIHIVPLPKPGKGPSEPASRRSIFLLNSFTKLLESIVYHHMLPQVEPRLYSHHIAYCRMRGTKHHLVPLMDAAHRTLLEGSYVYFAAYDIARAFDRVSHHQLMAALAAFGIDTYTRRLLREWITGRSFVVKLRSPTGVYFGARSPISSGLPQGGVLSPLSWLMFFDGIHDQLHSRRVSAFTDLRPLSCVH